MKRKLLSITLALVMVLSLMTGLTMTNYADDTVFYTLTPAEGTNNSYAGNCDITIDGIVWNVNGNTKLTQTPFIWRLGGKSISNVNRTVYSKTAMAATITKVDLMVGSSSGVTVNSLTLTVANNSSFTSIIDEVSATFVANSTINFTPSLNKTWSNGAFYKFTFNVTVSGSNNKGVDFAGAVFYGSGNNGNNHNHDLVYTHTNGTEGASSTHTITCKNEGCGDYPQENIPCTFTTSVVAPSYESEGYTRHTCTFCAYYYDTDVIPSLTPINGQFVIAAKVGNIYYALPSPFSTGRINGSEITVVDGKVSKTIATDYTVTIETIDGYCTIMDSNSDYLGHGSTTNLSVDDSVDDSSKWIISTNEATNGTYRIRNFGDAQRALIFRAGDYNVFGAYAISNVNGTEYYDMELLGIDVSADKTSLNNAIASAQAKVESDYTADSWAALATALATAQTIAAKADATQQEVDDAASALTTAINNLVRLHNYKTIYVINNIEFDPAALHVYLWKDGSNNNNNWPGPALTDMTDYAVGEGTAHTSNGDKAFYSFQVDLVEYDHMIFNWGENQAQTSNLDLTASDPVYYINDGALGNANSVTTSNDVFLTANYVNTATCEDAGYEYYTGLISSENHSAEVHVDALGHIRPNSSEGYVFSNIHHTFHCTRCDTDVTEYCTFENNHCTYCGNDKPEQVLPYGQYVLYWTDGTDISELESIGKINSNTVGIIEDCKVANTLGGLYVLDLIEGTVTGSYSFKNGDDYLAWSSGNTLITSQEQNEHSSWTIEKNSDGTYSIRNVYDSARMLQYNKQNTRFACYLSTSNEYDAMLMRWDTPYVQMSLTTESTDNGAIKLNYYIQASDLNKATLSGNFDDEIIYKAEAADGINSWELTAYGYKVSYAVPMKNFNDNVTLELYKLDNNQDVSIGVPTGYPYCVQDYLTAVSGSSQYSTELKNLVNAINNLGRTAEALFSHNYDGTEYGKAKTAIATAFTSLGIDVEQYNYGVSVNGSGFYGSSLILEDQVTLRFYFDLADADYTVTIDNKSGELKKKGNQYYCDVENIAAKLLNESHTIVIKNGNDEVVRVTGFKPLTYAMQVIKGASNDEALIYLCKALYVYQAAAAAYFN